MAECIDRYDLVCRGQFEHINRKLDRIDLALRGDGEKPGLIIRIDRLERIQTMRSRLLWIIAGAVVVLAVGTIGRLLVGV